MAVPPTTAELRLKLLIDTKSRRVLFAEAGKDAVDFLFSLLATAAALLGPDAMVGSVGNLYFSMERLDDSYLPMTAALQYVSPSVAGSSGSG
ncbi:unnamed protein product [Urochloa humidicola]